MNDENMNQTATAEIEEGRIDLENADFLEQEELNVDTDVDAFSSPAPVPDAEHFCVLEMDETSGIEVKKYKTGANKGKYYGQITVISRVSGGDHDGRVASYDRVNTMVRRDGGSRMARLLFELGVDVPARVSVREMLKLLRDVLVTKPSALVTTQWEANWKNPKDQKYVTIKKGMRNFPPKLDENGEAIEGEYEHVLIHEGEEVSANAVVTRYRRAA